MQSKLTIKLRLQSGDAVVVGMTVIEDPRIPTPSEPDVVREPTIPEYTEILGKLMKMDIVAVSSGDEF